MPARLQALADESAEAEPEAARDETSFRSLLAELDTMEEGLKTDFDDLLEPAQDAAAEQDALETEPDSHQG
ncbi:hypothetical protein D3C86_1734100 [compost metagenome]